MQGLAGRVPPDRQPERQRCRPKSATRKFALALGLLLCTLPTTSTIALAQQTRFRPALPGYRFEFPRDHFSHPDFRTEWWYYSGNMRTPDGRSFGFELTFFREGVANPYPNSSRWRIEHLYLAHLAVTDIQEGTFRYAQRMHRGALGLAGASTADRGQPLSGPLSGVAARVWVGDWSATISPQHHRLEAAARDFALRLELRPAKPPVIHGRDGISRKGPGVGHASHYYSFSRLQATGAIRLGGQEFPVAGLAWMDHEFSSSQLAPEHSGWDWFSLQFEDGSELMLIQFRRRDGSRDSYSAGTYVPAQGPPRALEASQLRLLPHPGAHWRSPRSGAQYPLDWQVRVPELGLDLEVRAAVPAQELVTRETTGVTYWEGAIHAGGQKQGRRAVARGYLEMTGYAPGPSSHTLRYLHK